MAWAFWIDVGGTFTDCVGRSPQGDWHQAKVLSGDDSPIVAIRQIMGLEQGAPIGRVKVGLGTTRGTNALLERKGARVALITTQGFGDLLNIGTQARPHLFDLNIKKPSVLYKDVYELNERLDARGAVVKALDRKDVVDTLQQIRSTGVDSIAVCLLHAYLNNEHEMRVAQVAREMGFGQVSVSSELSPTIKALDRCDTAVLDAYLSPVIRTYLANLKKQMPGCELKVMTSAGAVIDSEAFVGKDSLFSGPAGGVVGCAHVAKEAGFTSAIGFDMGGTSTDVCRFDGRYEYCYAGEVAGVRVVAPMLAIETVAAGGGSVCEFTGGRLTVGPDSAGSDPGPACYGQGGPLAVTDINLFNGKIDPTRFPFPLNKDVVAQHLDRIAQAMGNTMSPHEIADGFTKVANLKMAAAIKRISTAHGYDPADHALVAFGGAAAQHGCAIARSLGMKQVLLHPLAGILSAYGISMADVQRFAERSVLKRLCDEELSALEPVFGELEDTLTRQVLAEGVEAGDIDRPIRLLDLRYQGEETSITIERPKDDRWAQAFERMHLQLYGHVHHDRPIEIATLRVEVTGRVPKPTAQTKAPVERTAAAKGTATVYFDAEPHETPWFERSELQPGDRVAGPAIIYEALSTIVIDPGWSAEITERYDLMLTDNAPVGREEPQSTRCDPVRLELFNNHFTHIATQMGLTLQRTSMSVNVKERLDFSCAILDSQGHLVVNAPHIPVHLGAMGASARGLIEQVKDLRPGDAYLSNDPDLGGSHLPDLTVISPVFDQTGSELRFFTASRAHHAEIGGVRPGSTFPHARSLAEEGVVFRNLRIARAGGFDEAALHDALTAGEFPSRAPQENIADVRAALAANTLGTRELQALIDANTWPVVSAYMGFIRDSAAQTCREMIGRIDDGCYVFDDQLDDGAPLRIAVMIEGTCMTVDFSGTGPVNDNAFNANLAVVTAAILYCLRCMIDQDIPLNSGVLEPIEITLPTCMLNPPKCEDPRRHAAVAAGNVELSQRIVDMFFGALGVVSASQGTMNNLIFGDDTFGYYETICGGAGAGPGFEGADAVHTHMTNTRMTDVEVLEAQYPVRVRRFAIRRGSGGAGRYRGGDGVIREIEFLKPVRLSLLSQRRSTRPFGLAGGQPAQPGRNLLRRAGEHTERDLGPLVQIEIHPHDSLTILTPGGGGYQAPDDSHA